MLMDNDIQYCSLNECKNMILNGSVYCISQNSQTIFCSLRCYMIAIVPQKIKPNKGNNKDKHKKTPSDQYHQQIDENDEIDNEKKKHKKHKSDKKEKREDKNVNKRDNSINTGTRIDQHVNALKLDTIGNKDIDSDESSQLHGTLYNVINYLETQTYNHSTNGSNANTNGTKTNDTKKKSLNIKRAWSTDKIEQIL